jgi:hypothetical protein
MIIYFQRMSNKMQVHTGGRFPAALRADLQSKFVRPTEAYLFNGAPCNPRQILLDGEYENVAVN